jgi:hypothetical protein
LVRKLKTWTDADGQKAQRLAAALQQALGGAPAAATPAAKGVDAGTRAFAAQHGVGLATALEHAASALQQNPQARDPLKTVLKTMQPLRGIASLADHPPLPDLLDGIERAIGDITRRSDPAAGVGDLLRSAAKAIARAVQEIGVKGQADPDSPEANDFAHRLGGLLGASGGVVSIESLYYGDAGPHVLKQGTAPAAQLAKPGSLELVAQGEHLRQTADALERALSPAQRELRAQALAGTFRALASAGAGPLGSALAGFAQAGREALARGQAVRDPNTFARHLREAGALLSSPAESETALAQRLAPITQALEGGTPAAAPVPTPTTGERGRQTSAGEPEAAPEEGPGLVGSFQRFERMVSTLGQGSASLDELLAGPPKLDGGDRAAAPEAGIAPITEFLYSGQAALDRALSLRERVRAARGEEHNDLVEEILDLVKLGVGRTS